VLEAEAVEAATVAAGAEAVDGATVGSEKVVSDWWFVISVAA